MEHTSGVFQNARLRSGDGQFDSEEDAAVGKTDCTTMLKLVPFETHTEADSLKLLARIGPTDAVYERGKSVELLLFLEAKSGLVNVESIARAG